MTQTATYRQSGEGNQTEMLPDGSDLRQLGAVALLDPHEGFDVAVKTTGQETHAKVWVMRETTVPDSAIKPLYATPDRTSGVITGISVYPTDKSHEDQSETPVIIATAEGSARLHQPIYDYLGINEAFALQTIDWKGQEIQVGGQYAIDERSDLMEVNIFFDHDYGAEGEELEAIIGNALVAYGATSPDMSTYATVAYQDTLARKVHFFD